MPERLGAEVEAQLNWVAFERVRPIKNTATERLASLKRRPCERREGALAIRGQDDRMAREEMAVL